MAIDLADLLRWVKEECDRRGCTEKNAQVRKMSDAARRGTRGDALADIQRDVIEELRLGGFYLPGEKTFEQSVEDQERANPTKVQAFDRDGRAWRPPGQGGS